MCQRQGVPETFVSLKTNSDSVAEPVSNSYGYEFRVSKNENKDAASGREGLKESEWDNINILIKPY